MLTAFNASYFAQKTLCAAKLDRPVRHIQSVAVAGEYAIIQVKDQAFPTAIPLTELEAEHDAQRTDRAASLNVTIDPEGVAIVTGGAESHAVFDGCCDCHDWAKQHEAGRDRPYCKHLAAVELSGRKRLDDLAVIAAGELAKADLGW